MYKILLFFIIFVFVSIPITQAEDWKINFTLLGTTELPGYSLRLDVYGNYAYIADDRGSVRIVDISDPFNPKQVGFFVCPSGVEEVYVVLPYVYVANGLSGFRVLDVSNPHNPKEIGSLDIDGYTDGVYVSGKYAYVVTINKNVGLRIIDISNPAEPKEIGSCGNFISPRQVYVSGDYGYVADYHGGLRIIDVSDPKNPEQVGVLDTPGSGYDVSISGDYAYIADGDGGGLRVIDVSDPRRPVEVARDPNPIVQIHISGKYAYIRSMYGAFIIMDVSKPDKPEFVGHYYNPDWYITDVYVSSNGYAYVTMGWSGFCVLSLDGLLGVQPDDSLITTWGNIKQQR